MAAYRSGIDEVGSAEQLPGDSDFIDIASDLVGINNVRDFLLAAARKKAGSGDS